MDVALAVEAREGAARRDVHEETRGQLNQGAPRVLVVLSVGDPVVVLDVLGEVAELLWRRVGEARHGTQALRETVVVVMAGHVIELVILLRGLVASKGRDLLAAVVVALHAALLPVRDKALGGALGAHSDPVEDVVLQALRARLLHGEDAHLAVEHHCNGPDMGRSSGLRAESSGDKGRSICVQGERRHSEA